MHQRCFIVNEIGEVCHSGRDKEEAKRAEEILRDLLDSNDLSDKFLAFCWLSTVNLTKDLEEETSAKLEEFKEKLENKELLTDAEKQLNN